ncbi:elongation of very long chain fatty acids protein 4-like [Contarinia nasturtii]|uniref:elongation of very long chain fatty acids protein 4-like n=1 Tax=Contarinia nasturtii TaxID=265458 RepID=UPI0012D41B76|nr:elongation of very long chain fatty acids protein 4-like [Contarinia nasturtii]XP_031617092.1 elongation of very long chain fatty acids protein 4-like [Contarinia nasturtii]
MEQQTMSGVNYDFLWNGDSRVTNWPLMSSPLPLIAILTTYLLIIYRFGPAYMENRKAYNLKWLLACYNLAQVAVCCYIIIGLVSNEFNVIKFWKCQSVDYKNSLKATTALTYTYQTFLLKLAELVETVFFVLRKKQNQVSKLHVYHHVSTATLAWILVKYTAGGMVLFSVVINSSVHVIMYSYYFAALFGPEVQRKLEGIKKNITLIQMIQFTIILIQCALALVRGCEVPKLLMAIYVPNVVLIFYMFYGFFNKAYTKKSYSTKGN